MIEELLLGGTDDWLTAADVVSVVKTLSGAVTYDDISVASLALIRAVVTQRLMHVGDVTDGGFIEWDLSHKQAIQRVEQRWLALGRLPDVGDVCWLANTALGDQRARAISGRRRR